MKGGVREGVTEQQSCEGKYAAEEEKSPELILWEWRHPVRSKISFVAQQTNPPPLMVRRVDDGNEEALLRTCCPHASMELLSESQCVH